MLPIPYDATVSYQVGTREGPAAIIAACSTRRPDLRHHVFTSVPRGFFRDSLPGVSFRVHRLDKVEEVLLDLRHAEAVRFAHGAEHHLGALSMVDSYHCSRYNTQTRRLTTAMFESVFGRARELLG